MLYRSRSASESKVQPAIQPVIERMEERRLLSASALDLSFSDKGYVTYRPALETARFHDVTVLPDGKVLAIGEAHTRRNDVPANQRNLIDFLVSRFTSDGEVDKTFGNGKGWVRTSFDGYLRSSGQAVVQLPDGKFAVSGTSQSATSEKYDFAVARYHADGSLDTSFSGDGKVVTDLSDGSKDELQAMAVTPDGKLLAVGSSLYAHPDGTNRTDIAAVRYNLDGSLDTSFDGDGVMLSNAAATDDPDALDDDNQDVRSLTILPDGRFMLGGSIRSNFLEENVYDMFIARFNANGSLDTTFAGGEGAVRGDLSVEQERFNSISLLPGGKFLAGGLVNADSIHGVDSEFVLVRFNADGTRDASFGANGVRRDDFPDVGPAWDEIQSVLVLPDGRILVVGDSSPRDPEQAELIALARYTADGSPDTSFSGDGKVLAHGATDVYAATLDATGRVVVAGAYTGSSGSIARFGLDPSDPVSPPVSPPPVSPPVSPPPLSPPPVSPPPVSPPPGSPPPVTSPPVSPPPVVGAPAGTFTGTLETELPAGLIGEQKIRGGRAVVSVTNPTQDRIKGKATVGLFLSTDDVLDSGDAAVMTRQKKLKLNPGQTKEVKLKVKNLPAAPTAQYKLLAQITAPDQTQTVIPGTTAFAVAQPTVDLAGTIMQGIESSVTSGGKAQVVVSLQNLGNVKATGHQSVSVFASSDAIASGDDVLLRVKASRVNLKPSQGKTIRMPIRLPGPLPVGTYFLTATVDSAGQFEEPDETNNSDVTASPFNVG